MKIFIIVNNDRFFLSHRMPVGIAAKEAGYDVTVVSKDTGLSDCIRKAGLNTINLPINKSGLGLRDEIKTLKFLLKLFHKEKPDIIHLVGLKTMLWGSIAFRLSHVKGMVAAICGLGVLFDEDNADSLRTRMILRVMRLTHKGKHVKAIFQNKEDKKIFLENKVIKENQCSFTRGSGIDLSDYEYCPEPALNAPISSPGLLPNKIRIILTARMVVNKGIMVLIEAAKKLESEYRDRLQFLICGGLETNPKAIPHNLIMKECDGEYICWLGHRTDVLDLLRQSHILAFPSWYREGLPKSVIEAEAIGRPIITTDSVGCRDTIIDGYNGILIPIKDSEALANAIRKLVDNEEMRKVMGRNAREFAEKNFCIEDVVRTHLDIYKEVI